MTDFSKSKIRIKLDPKKFEMEVAKELRRRMLKIAIELEGYVKKTLSTSNLKGTNPSKAGEAPHAGTGNLRNSITHQVKKDGKDVVAIYGSMKGPATAYAKRLELGFVGVDSAGRRYNMEPRPFLRPAYRKNKRRIIKIISKG